jgi:hypothetical protein
MRDMQHMQYTVSSGGRTIGVTALELVRDGGPAVTGWLHPNAEGERLLPAITAPQALPLTLHRPDGSKVPTASVGIRDTHQLLTMAEWSDAREAGHEQAAERAPEDAPAWAPDGPWAPDEEPTDSLRWQVVVTLADADAVP